MSAASVTAYLSPTILRKRAISSGESSGAAGCMIFIFVTYAYSFPAHRGAAQPIVDGFTEPVMRHRHDSDGARAPRVQRPKITEKIGGGLSVFAMRVQIHHSGRRFNSLHRTLTRGCHRLPGLNPLC